MSLTAKQKEEQARYYEKLRRLRREADRVLFSDGGRHWPIFRVKESLNRK